MQTASVSQRKHPSQKYSNRQQLRGLSAAADNFWYSSMRKLRNPLRRETFKSKNKATKKKAPHEETPIEHEQSRVN